MHRDRRPLYCGGHGRAARTEEVPRMRQLLFLMLLAADTLRAQEPVHKMYDDQVTLVEHDVLSLAEAMPADKYDFAPTNGNFTSVRTFGEQVKHLATMIYLTSALVLEERSPYGPGTHNEGPDHCVPEGLDCVCPQSHGVAEGRQPHDPGGVHVRADAAFSDCGRCGLPQLQSLRTDGGLRAYERDRAAGKRPHRR